MRRFLVPRPQGRMTREGSVRFSIVIAAYQAGSTIAECVESALSQTLPAHEVIVVDDGSTDDTAARLAPYRDRITYTRQNNRGAPAAANSGFHRAVGDFVAILDADDVYEPERIEALSELAEARPDLDILVTDAFLEVKGEIAGRFFDRTPFAVADQNIAIFENCFIAWPAVRRRSFLELGDFDETLRVSHDWEYWIRMLHAGCAAGAVDEPLVRYRMGSEKSLMDDRVAALWGRVHVLERAQTLDLSERERAALDVYLRRRRRRALIAEADLALREHTADARRLALGVALAPNIPVSTRVRAAAAAVAPRLAAWRLARLEARTGYSFSKRQSPGGSAARRP